MVGAGPFHKRAGGIGDGAHRGEVVAVQVAGHAILDNLQSVRRIAGNYLTWCHIPKRKSETVRRCDAVSTRQRQ